MKQKVKIIMLIAVQVLTACICASYFRMLPYRDSIAAHANTRTFFARNAATFDSGSTNQDASFHELYTKFNCFQMPVNSDDLVNKWINVTISGTDGIYSAFIDENMIRIIAMTLTKKHDREAFRFCHVWVKTERNITITSVLATLHTIPDNHHKTYTAAFYKCPMPEEGIPVAVAVSDRNETTPCKQPLLPVIHAKPSSQYATTFRVCVKPLYGDIPHAFEVIEWIEMNKILGVTNFTIYMHSSAKKTEQILQYYQRKGIVEILPWTLPLEPIHCWGQLAAINDCLYRNRNRSKYLAFFDMDEFIIPRRKEDYTWLDMMERFPKASAYLFRNTFFHREKIGSYAYSDLNVERIPTSDRLITLTHLRRDDFIWKAHLRSKLIVNPENIDTVGIHYIHSFKHNHGNYLKTYHVKPEDGLMHHYRDYIWNGSLIDEGILKYSKELIQRVNAVLNDLEYLF